MKILFAFIFCALTQFIYAQDWVNFDVNGIQREALIYHPTKISEKNPVIFVFHGHGGTAKHAAKTISFYKNYPEALVVYMQGIPGTGGVVIDKQGKMNGWQMMPQEKDNRDVLFYDEVLNFLKKNEKIDAEDVFLIGHSNGARFVNVLWKERPTSFKALISVAAQGGFMISGAAPKSVWMSMGKNDPLVPYKGQQKSINIVKNNLKITGKPYNSLPEKLFYKGSENTELVVEERNAGHEFPYQSMDEMVKFLKRQ